MNNKTSEAQVRASRKWEAQNKEKVAYDTAKRQAKRFVRKFATKADIEELLKIFDEENENS